MQSSLELLDSAPGVDPRRHGGWGRAGSPMVIAVVACSVLGIVSVLTLPSLPGYDPFAWVVWGREVAHQFLHPSEPFITGGGPSWKPLPVLFTTVFGMFSGAPKLWV